MLFGLSWYQNRRTVFVPDIIMGPIEGFGEWRFEGNPRLVVEIANADTRERDRSLKRLYYGEGGAAWYWLVDPDEPSLTVYRLRDGRLVDEATVRNDEAYETDHPLRVRVVPAELCGS